MTSLGRQFTVLCLGTPNPEPTNPLHAVMYGLDARFTARELDYPEDFGLPKGSQTSIRLGIDFLADEVRIAPTPVVLVGYAHGAMIIRLLLNEIAEGLRPDLQVVAAGLIADPWRPPDFLTNPSLESQHGWGVAGIGPDTGEVPVFEISHHLDAFTNLPGDSPIRAFTQWEEFVCVSTLSTWREAASEQVSSTYWRNVIANWKNPSPAIKRYRTTFKMLDDFHDHVHKLYTDEVIPGTGASYARFLADLLSERVV